MMNEKRRWSDDVGSIDFVQLIVGLLIVGIACVGTFQALQFGNDQLNQQMRYRRALSEARSCVEYWQGRIHTDTPNNLEMNGNLSSPNGSNNDVLIDEGDPDNPNDDVIGYVRYGPIVPIPNAELGKDKRGQTLISHYVIRTRVTWWDPGQSHAERPHEVKFQGAMVPAAL